MTIDIDRFNQMQKEAQEAIDSGVMPSLCGSDQYKPVFISKDLPMDNQHKKITGYRDLTQEEIDLMNRSKALASEVGDFIEYLSKTGYDDKRWLAIAKTDLQKGFMSLTRSIAKPSTF
ncbi:DUF7681 family protein [Psychrobacter pocilloporae]|uniref:Acb2/Tad1 domain-containing protein n=1 Tax=Psychrobacter pocilloporae TaxID=1775882 RepID=UPI003C2D6D03